MECQAYVSLRDQPCLWDSIAYCVLLYNSLWRMPPRQCLRPPPRQCFLRPNVGAKTQAAYSTMLCPPPTVVSMRLEAAPARSISNTVSYFSGSETGYGFNVQATCDADYRFRGLSFIPPGAANDWSARTQSAVRKAKISTHCVRRSQRGCRHLSIRKRERSLGARRMEVAC